MNLPLQLRRRLRFIPLGIGGVALIIGLWTGLARLGLGLPGGTPALAEFHSVLMIAGFLGTLISLERAVAIGRWWANSAPLVAATGVVALIAGMPLFSALLFLLAGFALILASSVVVVRQPALFTAMLTVAAGCWAVGTGLWVAGRAMPELVGWWLAFLVLTILAERLELSRLLAPPPGSQIVFAAAAALVVVSALRGEFAGRAAPFGGAGLIAVTLWLLRYDIALRTIRQSGQARFSAACMLAGYAWLAAAGLLLLTLPPGATSFSFDAVVHAITIGFVFSMIFGHAPIILPAVTGMRVRFNAAAYAPLALLHISALLRVTSGLLEWTEIRVASGLLTVAAIASYAIVLIVASRQ